MLVARVLADAGQVAQVGGYAADVQSKARY
jgi:hypothetical protein